MDDTILNQARRPERVRVVRVDSGGYRVWLDDTIIGHVVRADGRWSAATSPPARYQTRHGMPKRHRAVRWLVAVHVAATNGSR